MSIKKQTLCRTFSTHFFRRVFTQIAEEKRSKDPIKIYATAFMKLHQHTL